MENLKSITHIDNIKLSDDESSIIIIDQTKLPNKIEYLSLNQKEELYQAIKLLQVRGAPAIGIFAGYAIYLLAKQISHLPYDEFVLEMKQTSNYLYEARPTAVNLGWAINRMMKIINNEKDINNIINLLRQEAINIHQEDMQMCKKISEYGLTLLKNHDGILTHCNAGPLATSRYGTALGPIFLGKERGMDFKVYADETRPLLQGARLTSFELEKAGIDVTLICDNMASIVMKNGWVDICFVGCDRIAANGDVANKIGTSGVAILANYYGIPVYSLGPCSTIDLNCLTGDDIIIELRDPDEIKKMWYKEPMALAQTKCYNPSFDVTDHSLLSGIVTDKGIVYPPFDVNLKKLFELEK